uniref:Uncharacterized protein n=1 Tax=Acrobeloides nanus TaxID=290746 RepID=A0A914D299_9BILA
MLYENGLLVEKRILILAGSPNTSIAHVWKGDSYEDSMQEMNHVTQNGHLAIYSPCWYLDLIKYGVLWDDVNGTSFDDRGMYYQCNPTDFDGTDAQKKLVLGILLCFIKSFQ